MLYGALLWRALRDAAAGGGRWRPGSTEGMSDMLGGHFATTVSFFCLNNRCII